MLKDRKANIYKTYADIEDIIYKKVEEIVDSLTDEEREQLEGVGWVLDLEEVFQLLLEYLTEHFKTVEFSIEHVQKDLVKIDKNLLFEL